MIGAGAAGLVAAIAAARGPVPVWLLERTKDGGRKILISGGGRCNVLPSAVALDRFVTDSPAHLLRGMLRAWPLPRIVRFFEAEVGVPLAIEASTGKLFPRSNRARDVRDGLVALAVRGGVRTQFNTRVDGLARSTTGWTLDTSTGHIHASRVIVATGGLSVPATGSDGFGLSLARSLGHRVHQTYPALTPLLYEPAGTGRQPAVGGRLPRGASPESGDEIRESKTRGKQQPAPGTLHPALLAGLSLSVRLRARADGRTTESSGGFLFTHRGYSGPAVLDISHVCVRSIDGLRAQLKVAWSATPPAEWEAHLLGADRAVATVVAGELPERLALALMLRSGIPRDRRTSALTRQERQRLVGDLTAYGLPWTGHEGYAKAEVTGGGVALDEVNPQTLESRHCSGLYFCGEVLDAFGPIGGHNFAWAWVTGRSAGLAAAAASIGD